MIRVKTELERKPSSEKSKFYTLNQLVDKIFIIMELIITIHVTVEFLLYNYAFSCSN